MKLQNISFILTMSTKCQFHYVFQLPYDHSKLVWMGTVSLPIFSIACLTPFPNRVHYYPLCSLGLLQYEMSNDPEDTSLSTQPIFSQILVKHHFFVHYSTFLPTVTYFNHVLEPWSHCLTSSAVLHVLAKSYPPTFSFPQPIHPCRSISFQLQQTRKKLSVIAETSSCFQASSYFTPPSCNDHCSSQNDHMYNYSTHMVHPLSAFLTVQVIQYHLLQHIGPVQTLYRC